MPDSDGLLYHYTSLEAFKGKSKTGYFGQRTSPT